MSFTVTIDANAGSAKTEIAAVEAGLAKATAASDRARDANGRWIKSTMEGGVAAASASAQAATAMDRVTAASDRARDANGRWIKSSTDAGAAAAGAHGRAVDAAAGHGDTLQRLIHLTEALFAVHQFEGLVDGFIEIRNKTNTVAESSSNLNALLDEQFRIAQVTRSSWEDLAGVYQRISNAGRGLGLSQRQVLDLTEELSMGMRLSGASSKEASMSMMELTHTFMTGTLTGKEFRVLMKDAPALMHELQMASGKTGAEFAEMGKHGKITAETMIEWFGKAAPAIKEKFGQTIPTIAEGFQLLKNAAEKFFGSAAVGSGTMGTLSAAMAFVADHFETIGKVALGVGEALLGLFVIEKITTMVKALTVAIAANPLGVLLIALTTGIALLRQFGDEINTNQKIWQNIEGQYVTVGDKLRALWSMIKDLGSAILDFVDTAWHKLTSAFGDGIDGQGLEFSLRGVLTFLASWADKVIGMFKFLNDSIVTIFGGIPLVIEEAFVDAFRSLLGVVETLVNGVIGAINKLIEAKNWVASKISGESGPASGEAAQRAAEKWAGDTNAKFGINPNFTAIGASAEDVAAQQAALQRARAAGFPVTQRGFVPGQAPGGYNNEEAQGLIKPIDISSFKTQFDGMTDAFWQKFKDDWKNDIHGTNVTQNLVGTFLDELDKRSHDEAVKRVSASKAEGSISTTRGMPDARVLSDKEIKALEKYNHELLSFEEHTNPIVEAQLKLAHAQEFFTNAVKNHGLAQERANIDMENYRRRLADALDPIGAWTRKQHEATDALRADTAEQDRAAQLVKFREEMTKAGIALSEQQIATAQREIATAQARAEKMHAEQTIYQTVLGPQKQYALQLEAAADLLGKGTISAQQYITQTEAALAAYLAASDEGKTTAGLQEAAWIAAQQQARAAGVAVQSYGQVVDQVRAKQLAAGPEGQTFMGGLETGWLKLKAAAENYGATLATTLLDDAGKLEDAFVTMANGGKVSFSEMIDSMIQDLEKLILKQAVISLVSSVIGGPPLPHAATGGHWTVGGSGGTDSQFVGLMMTPGEHLIAQTPPQHSTSNGTQAQSPVVVPAPVVNNVNVLDPSVVTHVLSTREGQKVMINVMRKLNIGMKP